MTPRAAVRDAIVVAGRVVTRVWDVGELERIDPRWSERSHRERHALLESPSRQPTPPDDVGVSTNLVTDSYLESLAAGENPEPSFLAFGDGTTSPAAGNTSLNNEVYRTPVGEDEPSGTDRITSTFLSQNEANGDAIREVGFTDADTDEDWSLLSHVVLSSGDQIDNKTSQMAVTFNYTLSWGR